MVEFEACSMSYDIIDLCPLDSGNWFCSDSLQLRYSLTYYDSGSTFKRPWCNDVTIPTLWNTWYRTHVYEHSLCSHSYSWKLHTLRRSSLLVCLQSLCLQIAYRENWWNLMMIFVILENNLRLLLVKKLEGFYKYVEMKLFVFDIPPLDWYRIYGWGMLEVCFRYASIHRRIPNIYPKFCGYENR